MNNGLGIRVGIRAARPSIALANSQREASKVFHAPTLPVRDPEVSIADISCGIRSQRSQDEGGRRSCLASFNMILSGDPESVKEIALPYFLSGASSLTLKTTFQYLLFDQPGVVF